MTKSLAKTHKQIAKKRHGIINNLHANSRDGKRLHRAGVRDERLRLMSAARSKREQRLLDRVEYFKAAVKERGGGPLTPSTVQELISTFVHQHDEELSDITKKRRAGRPPTPREELAKMKVAGLTVEHQQGFLLPDLTTAENVALLDRWEGSWSYLPNLVWLKVSAAGETVPASFPPNAGH